MTPPTFRSSDTVRHNCCNACARHAKLSLSHPACSADASDDYANDEVTLHPLLMPHTSARSFIIELAKGHHVFSFVHVLHSIALYSTDCWYLLNRKILIMNLLMFVAVLIFEFLISSGVGKNTYIDDFLDWANGSLNPNLRRLR